MRGHFEAKKHSYRQTQDGVVVSFVMHPNDVTPDFAAAPLGTIFIVGYATEDEGGDAPSNLTPGTSNVSGPQTAMAPVQPPEPHPAEEADNAGQPRKRPWSDLPYATQAALRCQDQQFQEWLWHEAGQRAGDFPTDTNGNGPDWENWTKETVRLKCGVITRADIKKGTQAGVAWHAIDVAFCQATGQMAVDPRS